MRNNARLYNSIMQNISEKLIDILELDIDSDNVLSESFINYDIPVKTDRTNLLYYSKHFTRITKPCKLFHLSNKNLDGEIFKPRIPESYISGFEEDTIKRICFAPTISGAYRACEMNGRYKIQYVHVPENAEQLFMKGKVYKPDSVIVPDVEFTNELWVRCPVKMKCIAKIHIGYNGALTSSDMPIIHYKILEKY